jgi:tRNA pseudouridine55 synthase
LARYLESDEKEYEAEIRLGTVTDTLDIDGQVLETRSYEPPLEQDVRRVLKEYTGVIRQRPPSYSAIKVHGIPAHRLARAGDARELPEREVTIFTLDLLHYQNPCIRFAVRCSKGTYIRTLGADIGNRLGAGACLTVLIRTRAGMFALEKALTIDQLAELAVRNEAQTALIPPERILEGFPGLEMNDRENILVTHGNAIAVTADHPVMRTDERIRLMDRSGRLVAVGNRDGDRIRPEVVLV